MKDKRKLSGKTPTHSAALRRQAEGQARAVELIAMSAQTPEEIQQALHELKVHQVELEMQNEELRRTKAELEESRARYFDLYDVFPMGYCILSEQGLILEANLTAATLLSTDRSVLVKQPLSRFILKEDQDIYYQHCKKLFETDEPQECELRLVKPDGATFWAHLTESAARAKDGVPVCRLVISDITERKQAEDKIKRLESFNETITESIVSGVWISDKNDTLVYMNRGMGVIAGISPRSAVGINLWQSFSEEAVGEFKKHYMKVKESLKPTPYEAIPVVTPACKSIYQSGWLIPLVEKDQFNGMICTVEDVTERKRAEEALRQSEEKYKNIFENIVEGLYRTTPAGRFVIINPAFARICGYESPEEMMKTVSDIANQLYADPEDRMRFQKLITAKGEVKGFEVPFKNPIKGLVWVSIYSKAICDEQGAIQFYDGTIEDITERKHNEEQWRRSEFIINSANELMTLINRNYVYEAVNDSYCRTMDRRKADVIGRTVSDIWGKKRFQEEIKDKLDICFSGNYVTDEAWIEHPGLGRRYYTIDYYPYKPSGAFCTHAVVVSHDITDRKMAEDELKETEHKYHSIVENAHEGIFQTTRQGRFLMVNKSLSEMLGYDSADDLISSVTDISHQLYVTPGARSAILHLIDKMDAVRGFQTQFYRKDGRKIWVSINMHAVRSESGEILYYEGMNEDISERRKAEIALLRSNERLLMAQAVAKAGMWDWNVTTGEINWSDSLFELFGLNPRNAKASFEAWRKIIHPDDREMAGMRIDEALQQKKNLNSDYRVVLPDGRILWINAVGKGEYDAQGQPVRMIGICLDITERKEAEETLIRQRIQMQQLSSRLVEAEEAERKRITRELHDQVGQNLTALGINLNILRTITAGDASDKIRRSLDESLFLVKQTTEFTRNLMAELRPPVMDDYGLMASIKWYGERFAARTGITFNMKSVDLIPRPKGLIEVTLFRIIQEALTNAGKHAGARRVDVEGEMIKDKLRITLVDNGRGFDQKLLGTADGRLSWGIMTMVERAQSIGGSLTVESQPGRGTKIVVEVPI